MGKFTRDDLSDTKWIRAFLGILDVGGQCSVGSGEERVVALPTVLELPMLMALVPSP